jgi:hypothetical protein
LFLGFPRYICYKYLQKKTVPADVLKDMMEEWEWFYIAGGGNVISSTHVPMDIYSKVSDSWYSDFRITSMSSRSSLLERLWRRK